MNYNQQLNAMIDGLAASSLAPPVSVAQTFGKRRVNLCSKALSMLNLFVPISGQFSQSNSNATFTAYSRPLQRDVIVMGCALFALDQSTDTFSLPICEFRLRLPQPLEHLSQNYIFSQMAFAPGAYSVFFPAPFILKASEQIAVDFGWNAPQALEQFDDTGRIELVLFCVAVKDCLDGEDQALLREVVKVVGTSSYQRRVYLNSFTHGSRAASAQSGSQFEANQDNMIVWPGAAGLVQVTNGTLTSSETRPADLPLLITGVGINIAATGHGLLNPKGGTLRIMDTGTGHSFTLGDFIYSQNLFAANSIAPTVYTVNQTPGLYYTHFQLPVPHLLKPGATLFSEHIAAGGQFNPGYMVWECLTP